MFSSDPWDCSVCSQAIVIVVLNPHPAETPAYTVVLNPHPIVSPEIIVVLEPHPVVAHIPGMSRRQTDGVLVESGDDIKYSMSS
jgi:hypothetical protein